MAPLAAVALLAACATTRTLTLTPAPPAVVIPEKLRAPPDETLLRTLSAEGVQIYECRAKAAQAGAAEWVFVAPQAQLVDAGGARVGRHDGGPTWEAADGSKVVGVVTARVDAPDAGAIPWLLLATHSTGKRGQFARVASIQRVATVGGAMPATGCTPATTGQTARVPYRAQYVLYVPTF